MKVYNFNPGPSTLPFEVLEEASKGVLNYKNSGLSILEISHRSEEMLQILSESKQLVRQLLSIPPEFEILYLTGGASSQFFMWAMNLTTTDETVGFLDTGIWAAKAIKEAKKICKVEVLASSKDTVYSKIPKEYTIPEGLKFLHYTSNNTIYGTQFHALPKTDTTLVSDMSSDIFSKEIDWSKHGLVYAGAQKNIGPSGVTLVIVRKDLCLEKEELPSMLQYNTHIKADSLFNTPPVFPMFVSYLNLKRLASRGGMKAVKKKNEEKANTLYSEIERNSLFKANVVKEDRSQMNVCFVMKNSSLEEKFTTFAKRRGCLNLKGHRTVGGFRASIYNGMNIDGVEYLVSVMREFEKRH